MPGRYCWSCGRKRPNERFSRRSGMRGVCRDCYRLGQPELTYRQAVRDIDRALRHGELIPRRQRPMIERFLEHRDERIRAYAATVIAHDAAIRNEYARARLEDDLALEAMATLEEAPACSIYETDASDDDLPF